MATIPPEKIAEIRDRADIERVIGRTVTLKRQGRRLTGLCPFHKEKTPSFSVDPVKKLYHCFGCHVGGDVLDFVMRLEGLEFVEAARALAREVGIELPMTEEPPEARRARQERERLFDVNAKARALYERWLWAEPAALRYLREERKLTDETIREFHLGWAPESWDAMAKALEKAGVPADLALQLGLVGPRPQGGVYDKLRARVIFPIMLPTGEVAGFGARRADWVVSRKEARSEPASVGPSQAKAGADAGPKYLNSAESPVYDKSGILYGLDRARDAVRRARRLIVVEGYVDVIALHQAGVREAVAPCGTALSDKHAAMIRKLADEVVTLYDGDPAGIQATRKAAESLLRAGLSVRVLWLPEGDDPDTFVQREGRAGIEARLEKAPSAIDAFVEDAQKRYSGAGLAGLVKIVESVQPLLSALRDPLERDLYIEGMARKLAVDAKMLRHHLGRRGGPSPLEAAAVAAVAPKPAATAPAHLPAFELGVLWHLVEDPVRTIHELEAREAFRAFSHPAVKAAVEAAKMAVDLGEPFDAQLAIEAVRAAGATEQTVTTMRENLVNAPPDSGDLAQVVTRLLNAYVTRRLKEVARARATASDSEGAILDAEALSLHKLKASLNAPAGAERRN